MLAISNLVFANDDDILRPQRSNFKILSESESKIVYTYKENGFDFKTIEFITPRDVTTTIYVYNTETETYVQYDAFVTNINNATQKFIENSHIENYENQIRSYTDPSTLSYTYYFTDKGDSNVAAKSLAVTRILFAAAFPNVASSVAYLVTTEIFELKIEVIWFTSEIYIEKGVDPDGHGAKWHKETQTFYSNSRRFSTDYLGHDTFYYQWGW